MTQLAYLKLRIIVNSTRSTAHLIEPQTFFSMVSDSKVDNQIKKITPKKAESIFGGLFVKARSELKFLSGTFCFFFSRSYVLTNTISCDFVRNKSLSFKFVRGSFIVSRMRRQVHHPETLVGEGT